MSDYPEYKYPSKMSWFDAERRQRYGSYYDYNEGPSQAVFNSSYPTYVQTYYLDGTGTHPGNRKTITLTTLANGVTAELNYYVSESGSSLYPPDHDFYIFGTITLKDKNGQVIIDPSTGSALETSVNIHSNAQWSTIDKVKLQYISTDIGYWADGDMAYVDMFGKVFGQNYWESPNQKGLGTTLTRQELLERYNYMAVFELTSWNDYDHFMDVMENSGDDTPIKPVKPEDDPSTPSEDTDPEYDPNPQPEPVPFPDIPEGGDALSTGFIHVYSPTAAELKQISGQLWSDSFVNTIKKIQNDPMEAIISLHNIPFSPRSGTANCVIGNYDTGITTGTVAGQWYKRDLGKIYIPENWASALDYEPYVQIDCFIPYVGVRSFQVDDIIGKIVSIEMTVDIVSGAAIVHVMCGGSVLYTYNTSVSGELPVSQSSYAPMYNAIVGAMGNVLSGYGSAGAPGAAAAAVGSAINVALSKQHSISRSGSIGGSTGCMGVFTPYLIIHRPIQSLASGFKHFKGYPSNITTSLGSISGYTEIESIHLDGIACTEAERDEIRALLYNGVIF